MLAVMRDVRGHLQAVSEWWLVDEQGRWNPTGRYVWINQLEVNPGVAWRGWMRDTIHHVARLCPQTVGAYWERRDKSPGVLHAYRRDQLVHEEVMV